MKEPNARLRTYRGLLRLFPSVVRRDRGEEMEQLFLEMVEEWRKERGKLGPRFWIPLIWDVGREAVGDWVTVLRRAGGSWINDVRIAARSLARRPGFALGVVLTLSLGIGATTTVYTVVDGVMLRPLPYDDPSTLVAIGALLPGSEWVEGDTGLHELARISIPNYLDLQARMLSLENSAFFEPTNWYLPDTGNGPEIVPAVSVSHELFEILGVSPVLGRTFTTEVRIESEREVMLTYGAWQRRYGGDPGVLGQVLDQVTQPATIVGVLPRDFRAPEAFFSRDETPEFWKPLQRGYEERDARLVFVLGHLVRGASVEEARAEARRIAVDLAEEFPESNITADGHPLGIGLNGLHAQTVGATGRTLWIFLGAAGLLLLLAAMNAATLLLARALDRRQELGIRMALGAGRMRVVRLLMSEAGMLSVLGGALGVLLSYGGVRAFLALAPPSIPRLSTIALDGRVLVLASIVTLGAGFAAGVLPALRLTRRGPWERLQRGAPSVAEPTSSLRAALVAGQVGLAVILLSSAGLLFNSFVRIRAADPGFEPRGLTTMTTTFASLRKASAGSAWIAWDLMLDEIGAVPAVESVAGASNVPFQSPTWAPRLLLPDDLPEMVREGIAGYAISPGYLQTMGIALLRGRGIERLDGPDAEHVALVNESFVRTQLQGRDPMNLVVRRVERDEILPMRIVGVIADVVQARAEDGLRPAIYLPHTQAAGHGYFGPMWAAVRSDLPTDRLIRTLRGALATTLLIEHVSTMPARMSATRTTPRFQATLFGSFALVALLIAAAGLYGSLSQMVRRRQRELGIRMALGADRAAVLRTVLDQGMRIVVGGLVVGMIAALGFTRLLTGFLYGVEPNDPATLLIVSVVLAVVSAVACIAPARRAMGVDPVTVLKAE